MQVSKSTTALGAAVFAVTVMALTHPKAVHAAAAALVQVTNTASNPVVTQSIDHQSGQILDLQCVTNNTPCVVITSSLGNYQPSSSAFEVPAGKSFVVTSVDITALPSTPQCSNSRSFFFFSAMNGVETFFSRWWIVPNQNFHFAYPTGIVIAPSSYLYVYDNDGTGCGNQYYGELDAVFLQGYLTSN